MKRHLILLLSVISIFAAVPGRLLAEAPKVDHVIDLLHQAKDSTEPLPLLQKAHEALKNFKAAPNGARATAAGIGARHAAANAVAAGEHKHKAMEAIDKAIEAAKTGGDVKPKIEHAVALVHEAGNLKN